ncbi:hypothetical protein RDWZM_010557 [Blomia tropicalis]|uniref:Uncharacterized protein n=1 Tax=Blomia tropicalis TaxID=40697 RepID=A0A9Q0M191_BLOTA|nr:hypothetical protein RDWZM_010557 [Blomia tropicalis]
MATIQRIHISWNRGKPIPTIGFQTDIMKMCKRMLSAGFHVVGSGIEFHIAYIECLQQADKNILTDRYRVYGNGVCVNLSVSFEIGSFGDRLAYECNYI